jgi:S-adenosylmethionine:tRNA ribosyltransferase-isomerase
VRRQDFSYHLPEELIAQSPLAERSASRLLVLDGATGAVADRMLRDLPSHLRAGDLLVFNDTRVVAARVLGSKPSGGRVEIFLERATVGAPPNDPARPPNGMGAAGKKPPLGQARTTVQSTSGGEAHGADRGQAAVEAHASERREALVQLRASKPIRDGLEITTAGGVVRVLRREGELWRVETPGDALEFFERWGEVPLPPYIHRAAHAGDRERYQSIFAREKGAVAAPTASLHFDAALMSKLDAVGVGRAFVTLHVGAGTFQPLRTDDLDAHKMHPERVSVSAATWEAIQRTRAAGGRVVAVGTTVVRALESAALARQAGIPWASTGTSAMAAPEANTRTPNAAARSDANLPGTGWSSETRLFIRPGFKFQVVDAMVTNFHLPESTLLMLVSAFAGREHVLAAYAHAVRERYRFFSYGDAMLVMPMEAPARSATSHTSQTGQTAQGVSSPGATGGTP